MYPPVYPHDELKSLYPNVYLLRGSIKMGPGMRMNRNMIVLNNEGKLILINPVRMNDDSLSRLDELGKVSFILRLGDFHGLDDDFYLDRYKCEFWAQDDQESYKTPRPDQLIKPELESPFPDSEFFVFEKAQYPEAALLLRKYKLLITTDSVQHHADWRYFTWFTKFVFKLLGFKVGLNIGPPWLKRVTPKDDTLKSDFERMLALEFDSLVAAHGTQLKVGAKNALSAEVDRVFK